MADIIVNGQVEYGIEELEVQAVDGGSEIFETQKTLGTKYIDINGTYYASTDGLDGFSEVEVNVSGGGSSNPYEDVIDNQPIGNKGRYLFSYCQDNDQQFANHYTSLVKSKIDTYYGLFLNCNNLTNIDLNGIQYPISGPTLSQMFMNCTGLTSVGSTNNDSVDLTPLANSINLSSFNQMFYGCTALTSVDMSCLNNKLRPAYTSGYSMFYNCKSLSSVVLPYTTDTYTGFDSFKLGSCYSMFYNCKALTYIDLTKLDTTNPTTVYFYRMFGGQNSSNYCGVQTIDWGYYFNIPSNATIYQMFYRAKDLTTINYPGTKMEWRTFISPYATLFNDNDISQDITVHCSDGDLIYYYAYDNSYVVVDAGSYNQIYTLQNDMYTNGPSNITINGTDHKTAQIHHWTSAPLYLMTQTLYNNYILTDPEGKQYPILLTSNTSFKFIGATPYEMENREFLPYAAHTLQNGRYDAADGAYPGSYFIFDTVNNTWYYTDKDSGSYTLNNNYLDCNNGIFNGYLLSNDTILMNGYGKFTYQQT